MQVYGINDLLNRNENDTIVNVHTLSSKVEILKSYDKFQYLTDLCSIILF